MKNDIEEQIKKYEAFSISELNTQYIAIQSLIHKSKSLANFYEKIILSIYLLLFASALNSTKDIINVNSKDIKMSILIAVITVSICLFILYYIVKHDKLYSEKLALESIMKERGII